MNTEISKIDKPDLLAALKVANPALYGTFQGTALEFSRYCSEQFESEVSLKGIRKKLLLMLSSWLGIEEASFFTWSSAEYRELKETIADRGIKSVAEATIWEFKGLMAQPSMMSQLELTGLTQMSFGTGDFWCARFLADEDASIFLLFKLKQIDRRTPGILIHSDEPHSLELMHFIIEAANQASRWLKRLHTAQALLYQDDVTGLFNFRYLDVALDSEFRRLQRFHAPFSLLFIDLDDFKRVNDVYGHLTGSSVLRQVGLQIKSALRDVDIVIRYGGDEFVVVLIGTNSSQAVLAAERVRSQVDRSQFLVENSADTVRVSVSIGVASCPEHAKDKQSVLRLADETMYAAKRGGKNRVVMLQPSGSKKSASLTLPREG